MNTKETFIKWIEKNKLKHTTPNELARIMEDAFYSCLNIDVWAIEDYKIYSNFRNKIILDKNFKKKDKKSYKLFVAESKHYQTYLKNAFFENAEKDKSAINTVVATENTSETTDFGNIKKLNFDELKKDIYNFFENEITSNNFISLYQKAIELNSSLHLDIRVSIIGVKRDGEILRFYSDKNGLLRFSKINKSYEINSNSFELSEIIKSIIEVNDYFKSYYNEVNIQDNDEQTKYIYHNTFGFGTVISSKNNDQNLVVKFDDIPTEKMIKSDHDNICFITKNEYDTRKIDNKEEKTHSSRVCWDEYETALLIEAFWKIEENKSSKNEVLIRLSNDLRKRAVNNRMKIDDTFRNLNGIGLQLSNISLSFFPDRPAMHRTALFDRVANIYKNNRDEFDKILLEAHRQVNGESNLKKTFTVAISEVDFYSYIKEEYSEKHKSDGKARRASQHAEKCIGVVRKINLILKESKYKNLYSTKKSRDVYEIMSYLKGKITIFNVEEKKWIWYVLNRYKTFIALNEKRLDKTFVNSKITNEIHNSNQIFYIKTKSGINASMIIENGKYKVLTGSSYSLEPSSSMSHSLIDEKYIMQSKGIILNGKFLKDYIFNSPSSAAVFVLGRSANGKIEWKTENGQLLGDLSSDSLINQKDNTVMSAEDRISKYPEYVQILKKYFSDGFAFDNAIRKRRFIKAYEEMNNKEFHDSETQYKEKISTVCFCSEGKTYLPTIVTEQISNDLKQYIEKNIGSSVIYYSVIYDAFRDKLNADFSNDMLKEYLKYMFSNDFKFENDYIANIGAKVDIKQELINVFNNVGRPMDVSELYSKLPNVSQSVINDYLCDKDFVVNFRGKSYFYKDIFEINERQLDEIRNYLNDTIQKKDQVTGSELYTFISENIPELLELNPDVLDLGFKNMIKLLLNEEFSFKGDVISTYGKQIDVRALYQDFCQKREKFTLEELEEFRDSINQSYIDYNGVFEISIRVDENTFVRRDLVDFDIQKNDEAILGFCSGKYVSFLDIINFHEFPNTRYPWNKYLLEGYLFKGSEKFGVLNAAFNKKKPVGAIIKKDAFESFDDLLVEVIRDNKLFDKERAFEYLQENDFILTKKVKNIDYLINKAKN